MRTVNTKVSCSNGNAFSSQTEKLPVHCYHYLIFQSNDSASCYYSMTVTNYYGVMEQFDEIRPYHDEEVRPALDRLLLDRDFLSILARYSHSILAKRCPRLIQWLTGAVIRRKLRGVDTIDDFQKVIEVFMTKLIKKTTSKVSFSGLENLKKGQSYLFLSNHRDIILDPALVHYGVFWHGLNTPRIAIGDNLLTHPFVSNLMRLNKSFIVKRSVSGRKEKLDVYKTLSAYIRYSIDTGNSVWLAHSEGRAKDGNDQTDTAIIKMLHMSMRCDAVAFTDSIHALNILPVAISYEYDPCDQSKANELYNTAQTGHYQKAANEDMLSIVESVEGAKGHIHVAFGSQLNGVYQNASDVSAAVDQQIYTHYLLHPSNYFAWEHISKEHATIDVPNIESVFPHKTIEIKRQQFFDRMETMPKHLHPWIIAMYAKPVLNRYQKTNAPDS